MFPQKNRIILIVIFIILTVISVLHIFGNSIQSSKESNARSETIVENIKPIVDPKNTVSSSDFNKIIRKLAHGIEFAILGFSVGGLYLAFGKSGSVSGISTVLFAILSTAVADEFIQSFTGRTSSVKDVVIDFFGGVVGYIIIRIVYGIAVAVTKCRKRKLSRSVK